MAHNSLHHAGTKTSKERKIQFVIEHLFKSYDKKEVQKDINFRFDTGKIYGLLGRNGAGKTTLFNCLNRDIRFDSGCFYLEDNGLRRDGAEKLCLSAHHDGHLSALLLHQQAEPLHAGLWAHDGSLLCRILLCRLSFGL